MERYDSLGKSHKQMSKIAKRAPVGKLTGALVLLRSCRGYTPVMQLVTPRAVAMAVRIEMAV